MKFTIPKLTAPEVKFARTTEGILIIAFNVAVIAATLASHIITGSHGLSITEMTKWLGIVNSISVFSRSGLKAVMSATKIGLPAPAQLIDPTILSDADSVASQIADDVVALTSKPESATVPDPGPPAGASPVS